MSRKGTGYQTTGKEQSNERIAGRHSDKFSQSADATAKTTARAEEKRARRRERLQRECRANGEIPAERTCLNPLVEAMLARRTGMSPLHAASYADEELRCDPEQETVHQRPDDHA